MFFIQFKEYLHILIMYTIFIHIIHLHIWQLVNYTFDIKMTITVNEIEKLYVTDIKFLNFVKNVLF